MGTVQGREVTISFDGKRCIHARHCVLGNPAVFVPNAPGEWIHPDAGTPEQVMRIAHACPSGAIHAELATGETSEAPPPVNTIRLRENGPLAIEAPHTINGADPGRVRAVLCRCGQSQRKPYCDGSHTAAGFAATGEPAGKESFPLPARDGPVEIEPQKNGSLKITGNIEIVSGTGRTLDRVAQVWLCRCGQSKNKPYCDGSHRAAGFVAD